MPIPVIIDTDPGIDDAVALGLAIGSPEIDLVAVTAVAGNAPLERTTRNAQNLLYLLGSSATPVGSGARRSIARVTDHHRQSPHGVDGLGGVELAPNPHPLTSNRAIELMAQTLTKWRGCPLTVVAIGPLTNIALLLALYPEAAEKIGELVVMGGCIGRGNITPVAEFNTWTDPEAAHRVLAESGLPIRIVGLNVTRSATVDEALRRTLAPRSRAGRALADMVSAYGDESPTGKPLHDALAVAAVINPRLISTSSASVGIDTSVGPGRGQTIYSMDEWRQKYATTDPELPLPPTRVDVALDVDNEGFRHLVRSCVAL